MRRGPRVPQSVVPTPAQQLLDAFGRKGWDSQPYERMLDIARTSRADLLDLVLRSIDVLPRSPTFVDGALSLLDDQGLARAVELAVGRLPVDPATGSGDTVAESVVAHAGLQDSSLLAAHLPLLWELAPNRSTYYASWPWRACTEAEADRLLRVLREGGQPDRLRAWWALRESRRPDVIGRALPAVGGAETLLELEPARYLPEVGLLLDGAELRPLNPPDVFHLVLPEEALEGRWDGPAHLRPENHPTWERVAEPVGAAVVGGVSADSCGLCSGPLHRLLRLGVGMPQRLGVHTVQDLELATCLSCLVWVAPALFYAHDADGVPHPLDRRAAPLTPEFPSSPLLEVSTQVIPTPARWRRQDWGLANSRENLHRVGGEPTWIQGAEHLTCPRCDRTMTALAQLDSELATEDGGEFLWGSGGIGYVQWCDGCAVSGVTAQWT